MPFDRRAVWVTVALTIACGPPVTKTYPVMPSALVSIDPTHDRSTAFGRVFCATLQHFRTPNDRSWGNCNQYVERANLSEPSTSTLTTTLPLLLVGGLGDDCLADASRVFAQARAHLHDAHQIDVETLRTPPFASSVENGRALARTINDHWEADPAHRPYVLIGYSKGAADLEETLPSLPKAREQVAALVTIAGLVNGTPEARALNPFFAPSRPWTDRHCPIGFSDHLSLAPDVRHDFLRAHPVTVPSYSLIAVSTERRTSPVLRGSWKRLSKYVVEQDGLVAGWDAVLAGGTYLGMAHADHLAVALSLGNEKDKRAKPDDPNWFPRDALFEAIVRFVVDDIRARPAAQ